MNLLTELSAPVRKGVRANLVPGLVLQAFALSLVIGYYIVPEVRTTFDAVGAWKLEGGHLFSSLSTAVFGGLIPFLVLRATGHIEKASALRVLFFYLGFWLWKGAEIDAFYRAQTALFGSGATARVLVPKVLFDQFVYNPLWAAPTQALCFLWKDSDFQGQQVLEKLRQKSLTSRSIIILVSTWVVWIPAVAIIYSLPAELQIPLFNLVLCFWSLLLSFVSREG